MNAQTNGRGLIEWIDIAKAIAIVVVVVGHSDCPEPLRDFIFAFHMPFFFFISGYLFNFNKYGTDFRGYFAVKSRRLVLPYFVSCGLFFTFWAVVKRHYVMREENVAPIKAFAGIFYGNTPEGYLVFNPALWFLVALFGVMLVLYLIVRVSRGNLAVGMSLAAVAYIAGVAMGHFGIYLPWSFDVALSSCVFAYLGHAAKRLEVFEHAGRANLLSVVVIVAACAGITLLCSMYNGYTTITMRMYGNPLVFLPGAVAGILMVILPAHALSSRMPVPGFLRKLGGESMIIYIFHLISLSVVSLFFRAIGVSYAERLNLWFVFSIFGILFPLLIGSAIKRIPFLRSVFYG